MNYSQWKTQLNVSPRHKIWCDLIPLLLESLYFISEVQKQTGAASPDDVCVYQMTFAFISLHEGNTKGSGALLLVVNTVTQATEHSVCLLFYLQTCSSADETSRARRLSLEQQLIPRGIQRKGSVCWVTGGKWWQYPKSTLDWRSGWRPREQRWILASWVSLAGSRSVRSVRGRTPLRVLFLSNVSALEKQ